MTNEQLHLPGWACVSDKRRHHITRVTSLLEHWASQLAVPQDERRSWVDAGRLHDALRDAPEAQLRALVAEPTYEAAILHGPAAATLLAGEGETRQQVLDAIRYHTIGFAGWSRTGRALYMADFLEPGRTFARHDRAFLAEQVVNDFDGVFRQVLRARLEWALHEGHTIHPETVALWNNHA